MVEISEEHCRGCSLQQQLAVLMLWQQQPLNSMRASMHSEHILSASSVNLATCQLHHCLHGSTTTCGTIFLLRLLFLCHPTDCVMPTCAWRALYEAHLPRQAGNQGLCLSLVQGGALHQLLRQPIPPQSPHSNTPQPAWMRGKQCSMMPCTEAEHGDLLG